MSFYAIIDGEPQLAGFDMSLAQYIADALGVELNVVPMDFNGIIGELMTGNIDLGIAGFSPDPTREDSADFRRHLLPRRQSFVIRAADAEKYTSYEDFDACPSAPSWLHSVRPRDGKHPQRQHHGPDQGHRHNCRARFRAP